MELSQKQKSFSAQILSAFLKCKFSLEHFEEKDDIHRFCISEIRDFGNVLRKMYKKTRFSGPFDKKHGKRAKARWKSVSQHLITFVDHCHGNSVGKSLPYSRAKSWYYLLTHRLPIRAILFLIETS